MLAAFNLLDNLENASNRLALLQRQSTPDPSDGPTWDRFVFDATVALYGDQASVRNESEVAMFLRIMAERRIPLEFLPVILNQRSFVDALSTRQDAATSRQTKCDPELVLEWTRLLQHDIDAESQCDNRAIPPISQTSSVSVGTDYLLDSTGGEYAMSAVSPFYFHPDGKTVSFHEKSVTIKSALQMTLLKELIALNGEVLYRSDFEQKYPVKNRNEFGNAIRSLKKKFVGAIEAYKGPGGGYYLSEVAVRR